MRDAPELGGVRWVWDRRLNTFVPPASVAGTTATAFIKGPLPRDWFATAAALPGKALHVALGLWWISGLKRSKTFTFTRNAASTLGVSPDATSDALGRLERAGLISVERKRGRSPVVTILRT